MIDVYWITFTMARAYIKCDQPAVPWAADVWEALNFNDAVQQLSFLSASKLKWKYSNLNSQADYRLLSPHGVLCTCRRDS